ncbi:MAG: FHA domain-containing protein [Dysgonamonadaceae bacterium]|jgi:V8-like Glu-specific endopeptidase|nr:FHA domain-containing protein [Dysgonamonadaceae bacterium]
MAQATNQYKRTVSGSIGAGIGSVFGGSGRTYFILEHKADSKYHRSGETQEIIVDQVEIGRDAKCQVRFDDSFGTVSRRHAAIYREGDRWKLVSLSETNSTLLNGQRIDSEIYLKNGDEIQLSSNGPRLGFIVPSGKKSTVGSIGLTRRLSLFRQQALTPYKQAITTLSIILVLVIAGGLWWGIEQRKVNKDLMAELEKTQIELQEQKEKLLNTVTTDNFESVSKEVAKLDQKIKANQTRIDSQVKVVRESSGTSAAQPKANSPEPAQPGTDTEKPSTGVSDLSSCNQYVYAIFVDEMYYDLPNSNERISLNVANEFVGTGFMLNDGRFITARHVVEPWYYYSEFNEEAKELYKLLNYASFNEGKIYSKYTIVSPTGKRYSFTNEQIICDRSNDRISKEDYESGSAIFRTSVSDRYDWAFYQTNATNGLKYDNVLSAGLSQGTQLDILGYPGGMGTEDINNIHPIYSSCITSGNGLNSNGLILSSNVDIAGGNSGGPVFTKKDGGYVVVGLLTGKTQIAGQKGVIVPIASVR